MITISDVINSINYETAVEEIKDFILAYIEKAKLEASWWGSAAALTLDHC
jgi:hypothetical protein